MNSPALFFFRREPGPEKPKITEQDKAVLVSRQGLTLSFLSHQALLFHGEVMLKSPFLDSVNQIEICLS